MLRLETENGWWLVTHPDHARLAGAFAEAWGNELFRRPEPRAEVLNGISTHDDGWALRDSHPQITKQGKPSAFSVELVGKYSAFEEIELADYLAVRDRAVRIIAEKDPYAGLLIGMHTYNLLTAHADRTTIKPEDLPLLDEFLEKLLAYQDDLKKAIRARTAAEHTSEERFLEHFHLLQACDNLSLLTCVAFEQPANLLHPLPLNDGGTVEVKVTALGIRHFKLEPWPFVKKEMSFHFPARYVPQKLFATHLELEEAYLDAPVETLKVTLAE